MLKKVVFLGLTATAVATVCAVKYTADHYDEIKVKLRKNGVDLEDNKTGKALARHRQTCPVADINALRGACLHGQRG